MTKRNSQYRSSDHERSSKEWHLDPESVRKVIVTIIAGLLLQTTSVIGSALWWASGMEKRAENHEAKLKEHDEKFTSQGTAGERIARLEELTRRLERAVDRIEDETRTKNSWRGK